MCNVPIIPSIYPSKSTIDTYPRGRHNESVHLTEGGCKMASNQIQSVRVLHNAIMDYMLANPLASNAEVAKEFQVTPAWLSVITNSDVFQEKLAIKQQELFGETVIPTMRDKLRAIADKSMANILAQLQAPPDPAYSVKAAEMSFKALGFGPSRGTTVNLTQQNNTTNFGMTKQELEACRNNILQLTGKPSTIETYEDSEFLELPGDDDEEH